jgi:hypothetical protein
MEVKQSVRLPAPVTDVWKRIGGFNALPDWHPMVEKSELAEGGSTRKLTIPGAGTITERLENHDDNSHTYSYAITDSPLPVADYHATIRVRQDGDEAVVEWESRFEPKGTSADDAANTIQNIFQSGFDNLQKLFGASSGGR